MQHFDGTTDEMIERRFVRKLDKKINQLNKDINLLNNINYILECLIFFGVFTTVIHLVHKLV